MNKLHGKKRKNREIGKGINQNWLPIDKRLIPDIFAFGHVRGIAKVFLEIEMILAALVVAGTFVVVTMRAMGF